MLNSSSQIPQATQNSRQALERRAKAIGAISFIFTAMQEELLVVPFKQAEYFNQGNYYGAMLVAQQSNKGKITDEGLATFLFDICRKLISNKTDTELSDMLAQMQIADDMQKGILSDMVDFAGMDCIKEEIKAYFIQRFGIHNIKMLEEGMEKYQLYMYPKISLLDVGAAEKDQLANKLFATLEADAQTARDIRDIANKYLESIGEQAIVAPVLAQPKPVNIIEFWIKGISSKQLDDTIFEIQMGTETFTLKKAFYAQDRLDIVLQDRSRAGLLRIASPEQLRNAKITEISFEKDENTLNRIANPVAGRYRRRGSAVQITVSDDIKPGDGIKLTFDGSAGLIKATAVSWQVRVADLSSKEKALKVLTTIFADSHTKVLYMLNVADSPQARKENEQTAKYGTANTIANLEEYKWQQMHDIATAAYKEALEEIPDAKIQQSLKSVQAALKAGDNVGCKVVFMDMLGDYGWYQMFYRMMQRAAPNMTDAERNMVALRMVANFSSASPLPPSSTAHSQQYTTTSISTPTSSSSMSSSTTSMTANLANEYTDRGYSSDYKKEPKSHDEIPEISKAHVDCGEDKSQEEKLAEPEKWVERINKPEDPSLTTRHNVNY